MLGAFYPHREGREVRRVVPKEVKLTSPGSPLGLGVK